VTEAQPGATIVDGVDIDAVHAAIAGCPGVSSVGSGTVASLTTYLPGRRVSGIRVNPDSLEIEIVALWGASVGELNTRIRQALAPLVSHRRLDITVADIDLPASPVSPSADQRPESELS
jgi:hypothetical protein